MAACTKCGFSFDSRHPLPLACPRCAAPVAARGAAPPVPPPSFGASAGSGGETLYGLPAVEDDSDDMTSPLDAGNSSDDMILGGILGGPPSIQLDRQAGPPSLGTIAPDEFDPSSIGAGSSDDLQLDVPGRSFGPPPEPTSGDDPLSHTRTGAAAFFAPAVRRAAPAPPTGKPNEPPRAQQSPARPPGPVVPPAPPKAAPPQAAPPRAAPPKPAPAGPPAVGLDDELGGRPTRRDLPSVASQPSSAPRAPVPPAAPLRSAGVPPRAPAPTAAARAGLADLSSPDMLDLPMPAAPKPKPTPRVPPPPPQFAPPQVIDDDVSTPIAIDLDERAPAGGHDFDLPAPRAARRDDRELDLPAPIDRARATPTTLGTDGDLDLPEPEDLDLPGPAGGHLDLLEPAEDLPMPVAVDLPEPVGLELEPRDTGLQPAALELEPRDTALEPVAGLAKPSASSDVAADRARPAPGLPAPRIAQPRIEAEPRARVSRGLVYGGLGAVLLAAVGAGVVYSGVLDGTDETVEDGTAPKRIAKVTDPSAPRTPEVLAAFAKDSPEGYDEALAITEQSGDTVGQAEAALLKHLRYGPEPVLVGQAASLLEGRADDPSLHVRRVIGLLALAKGDLAKAMPAFEGDDPRMALYRAMALLETGARAEAIKAAAAVSDDPAALELGLRARSLDGDSTARLELERAVAGGSASERLRQTLVEARIDHGLLAAARTLLDELEATTAAKGGYGAQLMAVRAELLRRAGEPNIAGERAEEALARAPDLLAAHLVKARALMDAKRLDAAAEAVDAALAKHPHAGEAKRLRVEIAIRAGASEEALALLAKLEAEAPKDPVVALLRGQLHAMRLELEDANKAFDAAIQLDPGLHTADIARARMLATARRPAEGLAAIEAARKRIDTLPNADRRRADLLTVAAELALEMGQPKAALDSFDAALLATPEHNDAQLARGLVRLDLGAYEDGKADLRAVYERTGGWPGLLAPLGRVLARDGKFEELEELLGDRLTAPRQGPEIKIVGARLRLAQGKPEEAKVLLDEAMALDPSNWEAQMLLAQAFLDGGDALKALDYVARVKPRKPQAELYLLKGKILEYNARHTDAGPEYLKALQLDPSLHEARFLRGRLLAYAGAPKQALEELQRVVDATNEFPEAWLNIGRAHRDLGDTDAALRALERAIELEPRLLEAYYLQGRLHYDKNQHAESIRALERATSDEAKAQPWYSDALVTLARAQVKAGRAAAARASFQRFLEVAPADHASRPAAERELRDLG